MTSPTADNQAVFDQAALIVVAAGFLLAGGPRRTVRLIRRRRRSRYDRYIHSGRWRRKCNRYYAHNGRGCHWPACRARSGAVHHLTYVHFRHERMRELTGLCRAHHSDIHRLFDVHHPAAFGDQLRFLRTGPYDYRREMVR